MKAATSSDTIPRPGNSADRPHRPFDRTHVNALPRQRYQLLRLTDDDGQRVLYVYDRALGRSLLRWRGAVATALLTTPEMRTHLGPGSTASCSKATVKWLMLEAAKYAADTRPAGRTSAAADGGPEAEIAIPQAPTAA